MVRVAVFNPFCKTLVGTIILVKILLVNTKRCAFNRIAEVALGYDYRPKSLDLFRPKNLDLFLIYSIEKTFFPSK